MTLKIEIVEGPGTGKTFEFDDKVAQVEIGRDPTHCQVLFPPDYTVVGRRHVVIRNTGGHWDLETNLKNPVLIDGREPFAGEALGAEQRLQLSSRGPVLSVKTSFEGALPATDPTPVLLSASSRYDQTRRRLTWLAASLVLFALLVLGGFGYSVWRARAERSMIADLTQKMMRQAGNDSIPADMLARIARSTYLVLIAADDGSESPVGTTWVYKPGLLATNSHVAETFNRLAPGQRLVVRGTVAPYNTIAVESVSLHPDYKRFTTAWETQHPLRGGVGAQAETMQAPGAGYDVAIMRVAQPGLLAPPLQLASTSELGILKAGQAVGYAGFPMEGLALDGINPKAPIPQVQLGHITALSDYFMLPGTPQERLLIQHSIPATGGASGSPMVDSAGHVIGLISGINIIQSGSGERAPSAAGINFAQRADLLREAEDGISVQAERARDLSWKNGFATFDDPLVLLPRSIQRDWLSDKGAQQATQILAQNGVMTADDATSPFLDIVQSAITTPGRYLVLAMSPQRVDINMALIRNNTIISLDKEDDWYPSLTFDTDKRDNIGIAVIGPPGSQAPGYKLFIWQIPPATQ